MSVIRVAYQGVPGAYSEKATRQLLGNTRAVQAVGFPSFEAAFQAVQNDEMDFGVLPIENSLGGSIHANYDLLLKFGLFIVGEYDLRVEHCLLALPGVTMAEIKTVVSHPQALAQCQHTIEEMHAQSRAEYDTAGSAKMLAENRWRDTAAIASDLAAEYYGLEVLERNVEDSSGNFTRFLLLSKQEDLSIDEKERAHYEFKTSLVFSFMDSNQKGQLYKALSAFSLRDVDLTKIESRPWGYSASQQVETTIGSPSAAFPYHEEDRRKYQYLFYVDIIGHQTDQNVVNALRHLGELCKFVRVLGSFPTKGLVRGHVLERLASAGVSPPNTPTLASPKNATAISATPHRLNVGIYGFGNFGQFLAKTITRYHSVRTTSRTDYTSVAKDLGCEFYSSTTQLTEFFAGLDVLVLCVSILSFEKVLKSIPAELLHDVVIVDVLSVKTHPKQILLAEGPKDASILCTHPMFGPESGKFSWRGLPMMYEKVRVVSPSHASRITQFLRVFDAELCRMLEMTCEAHDQYAASSQFLAHLTGRMLGVLGVESTPIDTRGFTSLVRLVKDTCKDSFDLFQGLYEFNPNSESQIKRMEKSLHEVAATLRQKRLNLNKGPEPTTMSEKYPLSPAVTSINPSKTIVMHGLTKQLESEGKTVWSLCVGEPDFLPDQRVLDAGKRAFDHGEVKYTDVKGYIKLRQLIAQYLQKCKGITYDPQTEILVSNGAKQAVYQAMLALCKPGEKVLIPSPFWVSYPDIVKLVGGEPVTLPTKIEQDYLIDPVVLEQTLLNNREVKALILCNPSNPSGTVHEPEHLERIAEVLRKPGFRHIVVVADEIYEQLVYQDPGVPKREHKSFASLSGMYERTLTVNGFSKSHAMTGLRVGYLAAPKYFVDACTKLQGQITSCASSISQCAAIEAMTIEMEAFAQQRSRINDSLSGLDNKRNYVLKRLENIHNLRFAPPTSAFYIFVDLAEYLDTHKAFDPETHQPLIGVDDFCMYLLRQFHVALVPGDAFGMKFGLRISYATSMKVLKHAMNGLENALASLVLE